MDVAAADDRARAARVAGDGGEHLDVMGLVELRQLFADRRARGWVPGEFLQLDVGVVGRHPSQQRPVLFALKNGGDGDAHLGALRGMVADQPLHDAAGEVGLEVEIGEIDQLELWRARKVDRRFGIGVLEEAVGQAAAGQRLDLGVEAFARVEQQLRPADRHRAGLRQLAAGMEGARQRRKAGGIGRRAALVEAVEAGEVRIGDFLAQDGKTARGSLRPHRQVAAVEVGTGIKHGRAAGNLGLREAQTDRFAGGDRPSARSDDDRPVAAA